ncbi:hypothetical protein ACLOJK_010039 [Asimina triloba]
MGAMREGRALDGASCTRSGGAGFVVGEGAAEGGGVQLVVGCYRGRAELTEVAEGAKGADLLDLGCLVIVHHWRRGGAMATARGIVTRCRWVEGCGS